MSWKCFKIVFKAEAPIHIGYKQIGILKATRYYITGRAIWGAVTANLTRVLYDQSESDRYNDVGKFVKNNIRTTYFYPAVCEKESNSNLSNFFVEIKNKIYRVFIPKYDEEIRYGSLNKEDFEKKFIGSFVSTALKPETKTAEEGSLHEIEYIKNKINIGGKAANIYWVGYIFANEKKYKDFSIEFTKDVMIIKKDDKEFSFRDKILKTIFVGGERNYGFGRLSIVDMERCNGEKIFNSNISINLNTNEPLIEIRGEKIALAHVNIEGLEISHIKGDIEPLVGREWSKDKGAGNKISDAKISLIPGTIFELKNDVQLKISNFGIWEKA